MTWRACSLIVAALLVAAPAHAQRSHIGIMAGPTASTMLGDYVDAAAGLELGFSFLATIDREFSDVLGMWIGVGWVQKGGRRLALADAGGTTWGYSTSYLEIPVNFQAKFRFANGRLSLAPHAGIAVGLGLGCKVKPGEQFEFDETCEEGTPGGALESLDLSVPVGAAFSVEFPGGSRFTIADLGYDFGLMNVLSAAGEAGQKAGNSTWSVRFGFAMPLY